VDLSSFNPEDKGASDAEDQAEQEEEHAQGRELHHHH
jgi:hypothetical protein